MNLPDARISRRSFVASASGSVLFAAKTGSAPSTYPLIQASGTHRELGRLLAVLRDSGGPVSRADFDAVWPGQAQLARALDGLIADGLTDPLPDGRFALPGSAGLKPTA